jgi:hypothetical protein
MSPNASHPIDAVILWVDGNDPLHRQKMLPYISEKTDPKKENSRTRFEQVDEIEFTVKSLLKYAPYLSNIFLITDNQTPQFLKKSNNENTYKKVKIIDHKTIYKGHEEVLPIFCSRSIETCMYRIPNLAEHFIYLNDDFFLINQTHPSDFFKNGLPVLRGKWLKYDEDILYKKLRKLRQGHKYAQQRAAHLAGHKRYFNFKHTPHPIRRSTLEQYFKEHKEVFIENIHHKFRDNKYQFLTQGLANHLEISNGSCYLESDLRLIYLRSYKKPLQWLEMKFKNISSQKLFLGLQSLDRCPKNKLDFLLNWLSTRVS